MASPNSGHPDSSTSPPASSNDPTAIGLTDAPADTMATDTMATDTMATDTMATDHLPAPVLDVTPTPSSELHGTAGRRRPSPDHHPLALGRRRPGADSRRPGAAPLAQGRRPHPEQGLGRLAVRDELAGGLLDAPCPPRRCCWRCSACSASSPGGYFGPEGMTADPGAGPDVPEHHLQRGGRQQPGRQHRRHHPEQRPGRRGLGRSDHQPVGRIVGDVGVRRVDHHRLLPARGPAPGGRAVLRARPVHRGPVRRDRRRYRCWPSARSTCPRLFPESWRAEVSRSSWTTSTTRSSRSV